MAGASGAAAAAGAAAGALGALERSVLTAFRAIPTQMPAIVPNPTTARGGAALSDATAAVADAMAHDVTSTKAALQASGSRFAGMRVHFVGIGGCGMSGLARMLVDRGAIVSGSDAKPNDQTAALAEAGVRIGHEQLGKLLDDSVDLVVRTAAVPDTHPELQVAGRYGITTIKYAQLLGQVMAEQTGVAVAGTHGKSTTTAMIAHALLRCGADPSFVVGGTVPQLGGGSRSGAGEVFVAEACEYDRSFHHLTPRIAVILNIEEDHLDCYRNIGEIQGSFHHFATLVPPGGLIISDGQDRNCQIALAAIDTPIEWVGTEGGFDWTIKETGLADGCPTADIFYNNRRAARLRLSIPGQHNLLNATMALAACRAAGLELQSAADAIGTFTGVDRRATRVGQTPAGATVVDDYGHHPTEVRATLAALRERYQPERLICVFQPHQHSRTRHLLQDFAESFTAADLTVLPDIYFVRDSEAERALVSSEQLVKAICARGEAAMHMPLFEGIVAYLKAESRPGDLIVTMGAGNVWEIGRQLVA